MNNVIIGWLLVSLLIFIVLNIIWKLTTSFFKSKYRDEIQYTENHRKSYGYLYAYQGKWELSNFFLIKIGRTNNLKKRMDAAKTSNPFGIKLLFCCLVKNDVYAETFIHKKFSKYRINKNNEWFFLNLDLFFYLWCINNQKLVDRYK